LQGCGGIFLFDPQSAFSDTAFGKTGFLEF
jgi:hypothetical protein